MSSLTNQRHDDVLAVLQKLKRHTAIIIEWLDASESDVLDVNAMMLPNTAVGTRIREIGWFIKIQSDTTWRMPHLLYYFRTTDSRYRISSIPLPLVKQVVPLEEKIARKHGLVSTETPVSPKARYRVQRFEGGVKYPHPRSKKQC